MESKPPRWLLLATSLPGRAAGTQRVRLWRALKEQGAVNLRDGLSLLPARPDLSEALRTLAEEVEGAGGTAFVLELHTQQAEVEAVFLSRFDREADYAGLVEHGTDLRRRLVELDEAAARRELRRLHRELQVIERTDFFPGVARREAGQTLVALEGDINQLFSPGEPAPVSGVLPARDPAAYRGRRWATRQRLWVDRVASAWLIRRFVDPEARFLWLERPDDCPTDALGFDFNGAQFTHVDDRVTFEVLAASFDLERDPGIKSLGTLVHYLDVGGTPVAEAPGFEGILAGMRDSCSDDDALLAATTPILDALYGTYTRAAHP